MSLTLSEDQVAELRYAAKKIIDILDGKTAADKAASNPEWRKEAPTEKQVKILKENGYAVDGLNRGMASDIIDRIFKKAKTNVIPT